MLPELTPVTDPPLETVAKAILALHQLPPGTLAESAIELPGQTVDAPDNVAGVGWPNNDNVILAWLRQPDIL